MVEHLCSSLPAPARARGSSWLAGRQADGREGSGSVHRLEFFLLGPCLLFTKRMRNPPFPIES